MDFSVEKYKSLLKSLISEEYNFQRFDHFLNNPKKKSIILRHDVDLLPYNSLRFAKIQAEVGIKGTYYFRAVPKSWNEQVIRRIAELGHEIGYHYECLTTVNGDHDLAIKDFEKNLVALRKITPVSTICMHGSPLSKYDSKDLWKTFNYRDFDIIGEPYFDVDFNHVLYLTDTGRKWDGNKVSIRDHVQSGYDLNFHKTDDIINTAKDHRLPDQIMFNFHPQRWNDNIFMWTKELVMQKVKNVIKRILIKIR